MQTEDTKPRTVTAYLIRVKGSDQRILAFPRPNVLVPSFLLSAEYPSATVYPPRPELPARLQGLTQTDLNELLELVVEEL
ncbi:ORF04 [Psittacine aviadenovirus B]|uniref:ORF04 n=1 Tax=psittacine adenovirus 4 TaxID=2773287 RepID=A0A1P8SW44_9ADEN|nr:ORF04 [Psittacine aviadenovirus B]APY28335.1 ORF04 [psittacine adenovirus 4]